MRSWLRASFGVALLALAVVSGWLAVGSWKWPGVVSVQEQRLRGPAYEHAWAGVSEPVARVLGARDDVAFRRAVAAFRKGRIDDLADVTSLESLVAAADASLRLAQVGRRDPSARRRSIATNLEAVLVGEAAELEADSESRLERAAALLRQAILLDPENEAAKANLERMLGSSFIASDRAAGRGFGGFGTDAGGTGEASGY